jgi:hypothetical protein
MISRFEKIRRILRTALKPESGIDEAVPSRQDRGAADAAEQRTTHETLRRHSQTHLPIAGQLRTGTYVAGVKREDTNHLAIITAETGDTTSKQNERELALSQHCRAKRERAEGSGSDPARRLRDYSSCSDIMRRSSAETDALTGVRRYTPLPTFSMAPPRP